MDNYLVIGEIVKPQGRARRSEAAPHHLRCGAL